MSDLQGFVNSYQALVVCRVILGFFEAGGVAILLAIGIWPANALKVSSQGVCTSYLLGT